MMIETSRMISSSRKVYGRFVCSRSLSRGYIGRAVSILAKSSIGERFLSAVCNSESYGRPEVERLQGLLQSKTTHGPLRYFLIDMEASHTRREGRFPLKPIDLAIQDYDTGDMFSTLINPGGPIHPSSAAVHNILGPELQHAPTCLEAAVAAMNWIIDKCSHGGGTASRVVLVAHNVSVDVKFLAHLLVDAGLHLPVGWLAMDTCPLAKNLLTKASAAQAQATSPSLIPTNTDASQAQFKQSYALDALVTRLLPHRPDMLTGLHAAEKDVLVMRAVVDQLLLQCCEGMALQQAAEKGFLLADISHDETCLPLARYIDEKRLDLIYSLWYSRFAVDQGMARYHLHSMAQHGCVVHDLPATVQTKLRPLKKAGTMSFANISQEFNTGHPVVPHVQPHLAQRSFDVQQYADMNASSSTYDDPLSYWYGHLGQPRPVEARPARKIPAVKANSNNATARGTPKAAVAPTALQHHSQQHHLVERVAPSLARRRRPASTTTLYCGSISVSHDVPVVQMEPTAHHLAAAATSNATPASSAAQSVTPAPGTAPSSMPTPSMRRSRRQPLAHVSAATKHATADAGESTAAASKDKPHDDASDSTDMLHEAAVHAVLNRRRRRPRQWVPVAPPAAASTADA